MTFNYGLKTIRSIKQSTDLICETDWSNYVITEIINNNQRFRTQNSIVLTINEEKSI